MTDRSSLLAAILANPADDEPRLQYSDWLQEHDEPERAEFIQVQVELASLPNGRYGCRRCTSPAVVHCSWTEEECCCKYKPRATELRRRERELREPAQLDWLRFLKRITGNEWIPCREIDWEFSRGFVSSITCSWQDWLAHEAAILREQPVERVRLATYPDTQVRGRLVALPFSHHWVEQISRNGRVPVIELLETHWPRIAFELPAEHVNLAVHRLHSLIPVSDELLQGNPSAGVPRGVIQTNPRRRR